MTDTITADTGLKILASPPTAIRIMEKREVLEDFSLLGGPLHQLGCRLGLVRGGTNTVALGMVLGASPWIVLLALALFEGLGQVLFSIEAIGAHVRLLVTILCRGGGAAAGGRGWSAVGASATFLAGAAFAAVTAVGLLAYRTTPHATEREGSRCP